MPASPFFQVQRGLLTPGIYDALANELLDVLLKSPLESVAVSMTPKTSGGFEVTWAPAGCEESTKAATTLRLFLARNIDGAAINPHAADMVQIGDGFRISAVKAQRRGGILHEPAVDRVPQPAESAPMRPVQASLGDARYTRPAQFLMYVMSWLPKV